MKAPQLILFLILLLVPAAAIPGQSDWPVWRGPNRNGIAPANQSPPIEWSDSKNVIWKTKVPGRGHASPIVVGNRIVLATADTETKVQSVVCFDRETGKQLWQTQVSQGEFLSRIHPNNTHASSTVASDGQHLFVVFINHGQTQLTALDLDGKQLWQNYAGKFRGQYPFGFGSSPIIHNGKVLVTADNQLDSIITAYDATSGEKAWQIDRPKRTSYSTPAVIRSNGRQQLVISGGQKIHAYDPDNGKELWSANGKWHVTCGTPVWNDELAFVSGGYPTGQTLAVKTDGSGAIAWQNQIKSYEQSMLYHDGYVYTLSDSGICFCWDAKTGEEMWKTRLENPVSASPVFAGGHIYFTSERGTTFVIKPNPAEFTQVAENKLGDYAFASMAVLDDRIYTRVGTGGRDNYQGWLYCLGKKTKP